MFIKKIILLFLVVSLFIMTLASCSPANQTATVTDSENLSGDNIAAGDGEELSETTENPDTPAPDLPDITFDGYEFRVINTTDEHIQWLMKTLVVEEETGEALNDAIYARNRKIEEQFEFELVMIGVTGPDEARDRARRSIQAGSDDFDLLMTNPPNALQLGQNAMLEKIDEIPHIDLSKPYWDQDMKRDFSIGGRLFFTSGDFTFNHYSATVPIFFNKKLLADLGLQDPYQLVRDGKWTIDKFAEMARASLKDLNGDAVMDKEDQWGYLGLSHVYTLAVMNGIGARYVMKDNNDIPYATINTEDFINRFYKAFDIVQEGWLYDADANNNPRGAEPMFMNSQSLFWSELMNWANILRSMENDFGILPMPKFDDNQEKYISSTGYPHVMCIPVTTGDLSRTGVILEALCAESRKSTREVYYDTMLKTKVMSRDDESGEMLDLIFSNRIYEIGRMYWESDIAGPIASLMRGNNRDIVSLIERNETRIDNAISKAIDAFTAD